MQIDWKFALDRREVRRRCNEGLPPDIKPIKVEHRPELTNGRTPYEGLYGKYDTEENMQTLYAIRDGDDHAFDQLTRIKLVQELMAYPLRKGGCGLQWHKLRSVVLHRFPLHDNFRNRELQKTWLDAQDYFKPWNQPLTEIREYLGEKAALYFAFIGDALDAVSSALDQAS